MSRTADYTIQGFIYQFIVTLQKLLQVTDANTEIIVEPKLRSRIKSPILSLKIQLRSSRKK